jgi:hypothetical protein
MYVQVQNTWPGQRCGGRRGGGGEAVRWGWGGGGMRWGIGDTLGVRGAPHFPIPAPVPQQRVATPSPGGGHWGPLGGVTDTDRVTHPTPWRAEAAVHRAPGRTWWRSRPGQRAQGLLTRAPRTWHAAWPSHQGSWAACRPATRTSRCRSSVRPHPNRPQELKGTGRAKVCRRGLKGTQGENE